MPESDQGEAADKEALDDEERAFQHADDTRDEEQDDADDGPTPDQP